MATTPAYGLRYLQLGDAPDIPKVGKDLAEDVEAQLVRIDADLATLKPVTSWATYTPGTHNHGSGAFSTRSGRWRRTGPKTVEFSVYFAVSVNGTGTVDAWTWDLPTAPDRTIRQTFSGHSESPGAILSAVTFIGGTGTLVDRTLEVRGTTVGNLLGADLDAGRLITISGKYEEA